MMKTILKKISIQPVNRHNVMNSSKIKIDSQKLMIQFSEEMMVSNFPEDKNKESQLPEL